VRPPRAEPFHGPGFDWRGAGPIPDAASQMLGLCLRWRQQQPGGSLTVPRLKPLMALCERQQRDTLAGGAAAQQRLAAALLRELLEGWERVDTAGVSNPHHAAARRRKVDSLTDSVDAAVATVAPAAVPEAEVAWAREHGAEFLRFIEAESQRARGTGPLPRGPLKHVLAGEAGPLLPGGLWLEFGVATGATLRLIAAAAARASGGGPAGGVVYGFDSFDGLPEPWRPGFAAGHFARPGKEPPPFDASVQDHTELVIGWFEDVLPGFLEKRPEPVALLHIDVDIYSAAAYVLRALLAAGRLRAGTVIVFDELFGYCGFEGHEFKALYETVAAGGLAFEWIGSREMRAALRLTVRARPGR
jgi:hypothetical protein